MEKYSTISFTRYGFDYCYAYPNPNGIETLDGLFEWESKDRGNRELTLCESEDEAKDHIRAMTALETRDRAYAHSERGCC